MIGWTLGWSRPLSVPGDARASKTPVGAGDRLAPLLRPARPSGDDAATRLAALEAQVAALTARLDGLEAWLIDQLDQQFQRLATSTAALIDEMCGAKRQARKPKRPPFLR